MPKTVVNKHDLDQFFRKIFDLDEKFDPQQLFYMYLKKEYGAPIKAQMVYELSDDYDWDIKFDEKECKLVVEWD